MSVKKSWSVWAVFGQAAWDTAVDMAAHGDVHAVVALWPSSRRGVFYWEARALQTLPDSTERTICRVQAEFPNSRAETLEAFLYSLVTKLAHCVDAYRADEAALASKSGK